MDEEHTKKQKAPVTVGIQRKIIQCKQKQHR